VSEAGWLVAILFLSPALRAGGNFLNQKSPRAFPDVAGQIARFCYFVGIPYVVIVTGLLSPRLFGLTGLEYLLLVDWSPAMGPEALQQAILLWGVNILLDAPSALLAGGTALLLVWLIRRSLVTNGVVFHNPPATLLDVVYLGLHWALYRAILWQLTGDLYNAVVMGALFALAEEVLMAWLDRRMLLASSAPVQTIMIVLTAVIFYYSPNWWLLLPFHWGMARIVNVGRG
jgi:hypothetical protein